MPLDTVRLVMVGIVVFLANAGLLVLQLVAGPLLSPFVGSSLETWTSVIASFLIGIALGNALGGRAADRSPTVRRLGLFLALGVLAALWMMLLPTILKDGLYQSLPLGIRIPVLALAHCLPVAFVLSLLTPLAIRICIPDLASTGRVAGLIFALSTLGCLLGNYLTGFVLVPEFSINTIILGVAGLLLVTALGALAAGTRLPSAATPAPDSADVEDSIVQPAGSMPLKVGFVIVFLCSFAGMTLELAATRIIAYNLGYSLYTWTGVIGVMLLGTACGNFLGGRIADRAGRSTQPAARERYLGRTLLAGGFLGVLVIVIFSILSQAQPFSRLGLREQILATSFCLFFAPMFCLGMISPQVIRLCVTDIRTAGRTAGRIYAVSTAGAIVGTFAAGYVLISSLGMFNAVLLAGLLPAAAMLLVSIPKEGTPTRKLLVAENSPMLYGISIVFGAAFGGAILGGNLKRHGKDEAVSETNYYMIRVVVPPDVEIVPPSDALSAIVGIAALDTKMQKIQLQYPQHRILYLDHLTHSRVDLDDPTYFFYRHETIQAEMLRMQCQDHPAEQNVLVIGGGGYTFPRYVRTMIPTANVDVVEIDPGVTNVANKHLGLKPEWRINSHHMDGRQFVAEKSAKGHYDLVTLDAVNDLSVPSHLLTNECNEAVKKTLKSDGIYLVTVIDFNMEGQLWKAAFRTLQKSFANVELLFPKNDLEGQRENTIDSIRKYDQLDPTKRYNLDQYLNKLQEVLKEKLPQAQEVETRNALIARINAATNEQIFVSLDRSVLVMYAADKPLNQERLKQAVAHQADRDSDTYVVPQSLVAEMLSKGKQLILTDQHAPTDDLMRQVFKKR